jgi:hypothetical protein
LIEVSKNFPQFIPFLRNIYGKESNGWFNGKSLAAVSSAEGYHQGDVLLVASWLFCLTIQPLLDELSTIIGEEGLVQFFIDDGNIAADFDTMIKAIGYIKSEGPKYGYNIKSNKGAYLMSKCSTIAIAHARKLQLVNVFGLDPEIVHIHPENEGSPQMYGSKVLGSYIGHDDYILQQLECRGDSFQIDADAIMTVHSKQTQYLLLKWCQCFSQKIIFIQRITPTYLVNTSVVETLKVKKIFGIQWHQDKMLPNIKKIQ